MVVVKCFTQTRWIHVVTSQWQLKSVEIKQNEKNADLWFFVFNWKIIGCLSNRIFLSLIYKISVLFKPTHRDVLQKSLDQFVRWLNKHTNHDCDWKYLKIIHGYYNFFENIWTWFYVDVTTDMLVRTAQKTTPHSA